MILSALSSVALSEQARLGSSCPFTVLATVGEFEVHYKAVTASEKHSLAGKIVRGSNAWVKRIPMLHRLHSMPNQCLQRCDLTPAASRYIVFESVDLDGELLSLNNNMKSQFESIFLEHLARRLPSIAIQSHYIDMGVPYLVDLASRNIPVLLLDSRERAFTLQRTGEGTVTRLAKESNAFPSVSKEQLQRITISEDSITLDGRKELVFIAETMIERKWECLIKNNTIDNLNSSMLAFFHSVLRLGAQINDRSRVGKASKLHVRIRELEKFEKTNKDSRKGQIPNELTTRVLHFIQTKHRSLRLQTSLAIVDNWLQKHDPAVDHLIQSANDYRKGVATALETDVELVPADWFGLYDLMTSTNTYSGSIYDIDELKKMLGSVAKIDRLPAANSLEALRTLQDAWDHFELYYHAASAYKIIAKVTYIILLLIGIAVTVLVLCQFQYDFPARLGVLILSLIGTALGSYVTFANPAVKWQQLRMAALSIESNIWTFRTRAGTYRANGNSFDQSAEKQLMDLLQEVKSTILEGADIKNTAFYSRSVSYNKHSQHANPQAGFGFSDSKIYNEMSGGLEETKLVHGMVSSGSGGGGGTRLEIMESLDTADSFNKYLKEKKVSGGADGGGGGGGGDVSGVGLHDIVDWLRRGENEIEHEFVDSHYEPLQPDAYIRHRVLVALAFYKSRIPRYNHIRNVTQLMLVLGSISAIALAYTDEVVWAAAIAIFSSGVIAYLEFNGTNSKINRYSFTVHALQELVLWWQTLSPIDRSMVNNYYLFEYLFISLSFIFFSVVSMSFLSHLFVCVLLAVNLKISVLIPFICIRYSS